MRTAEYSRDFLAALYKTLYPIRAFENRGIRLYRDGLNEALREEIRRDPTVFLLGEGIAERGGSYRVTVGLLDEFGPKRVIDTPIPYNLTLESACVP